MSDTAQKEIYLDYAATSPMFPEVIEEISRVQRDYYGNPSSLHHAGFLAEQVFKDSLKALADTMKTDPKRLLVTSGGSESDNQAVIGCAKAYRRRGSHLITAVNEHPAVLASMKYLESEGFSVTYLPIDKNGAVRPEDLADALRPDTILVSLMHVNNEVGVIQPVEEYVKIIKDYNREILFHTDAVQSYGKEEIFPGRTGVDLLSASAHKFHGPRGIGFLYIKEGVRTIPLIHGGGQQNNLRSGTENVAGLAGMSMAAVMSYDGLQEKRTHLASVKRQMLDGLKEIAETGGQPVVIHGDPETQVPGILNAAFPGIRSEVLLHALEDKGIYVSSGSACSSNHPGISATLKGMGAAPETLDSSIRFSFSTETTAEEIDMVLSALDGLLPMLRKFRRR